MRGLNDGIDEQTTITLLIWKDFTCARRINGDVDVLSTRKGVMVEGRRGVELGPRFLDVNKFKIPIKPSSE